MRILAISGSLRAASSNTALLRAVIALAPDGVEVMLSTALADLPHFNPDVDRQLDDPALPAAVRDLRAQLGAADALLISSPEYAHGVPGSLKNALDWLVGGSEIPGMPVALLSASAYATYAQASLAETLRTMSADLVAGSPFVAPVTGRGLDEAGVVRDQEVKAAIAAAFAAIAGAVAARRSAARD